MYQEDYHEEWGFLFATRLFTSTNPLSKEKKMFTGSQTPTIRPQHQSSERGREIKLLFSRGQKKILLSPWSTEKRLSVWWLHPYATQTHCYVTSKNLLRWILWLGIFAGGQPEKIRLKTLACSLFSQEGQQTRRERRGGRLSQNLSKFPMHACTRAVWLAVCAPFEESVARAQCMRASPAFPP